MIEASSFINAAQDRGFGLYTGVPCSYLKPFINFVIDSDSLRYVGAANEGDAVAIAAGAELAGQRSVTMFQNSGLGNAVNPITSLNYSFRIPGLLIPTLRGEPGGAADEPQHSKFLFEARDGRDGRQTRGKDRDHGVWSVSNEDEREYRGTDLEKLAMFRVYVPPRHLAWGRTERRA